MLSKSYYLKRKGANSPELKLEARWLLSFSDLLLLLIAVFVLKISMSSFVKPEELESQLKLDFKEQKLISNEKKFSAKYGEILWNAKVYESDLYNDELNFNLKEGISTIAKTFNSPDYQIILAYNEAGTENQTDALKSSYYNKLISQLIDNGIELENIFLTTDSSFSTQSLLKSELQNKKNNIIDIIISRNQNTF